MHTFKRWVGASVLLIACGGEDLTIETGTGGAGGSASGGSAGAAGSSAGVGGSAGATAGASGQGGAAPECTANGQDKCEGSKFLVCTNGQFGVFKDCAVLDGGKTPLCKPGVGCVACSAGDAGGCNESADTVLICGSDGKLAPSTKKCEGTTPHCLATSEPKNAHCVACLADADCPDLKNECAVNRCVDNVCKPEFTPAGTTTKTQDSSGCSTQTCNGKGGVSWENSSKDAPCQGKPGYCDGKGVCGECVSGAKECVDGGNLRFCQDDNQWSNTQACGETAPACKGAGECVGVVDMAVGNTHTCAVLTDGTARCWGDNSYGQLGLPTDDQSDHTRPRPVNGITDAAKVVVGDGFSCVLSSAGKIQCWGHNNVGQLGSGLSAIASPSPQAVNPGTTYSSIVAGPNRVCAIRDEQLECWGHASNPDGNDNKTPVVISFPKSGTFPPVPVAGVKSVAVGAEHTCLAGNLNTDPSKPSVYCFGDNAFGQLGNGTTTPKTGLVAPAGLGKVTKLVAGPHTTVAYQTINGTTSLVFWGRNDTKPSAPSPTPSAVVTSSSWNPNDPYLQGDFLGGWITSGLLNLVGINDSGQLGKGSTGSSTIPESSMPTVPGADSFSLWTKTVCAWKKGATAWCWGGNGQGQVGAGKPDPVLPFPTKVKW